MAIFDISYVGEMPYLKLTGGIVTGATTFTNNITASTINGVTVGSDPKFTDTTYSVATTSANGLMAATDKTAVNKIGSGTLNTTNQTLIGAINELLGISNGIPSLVTLSGNFKTNTSTEVILGSISSSPNWRLLIITSDYDDSFTGSMNNYASVYTYVRIPNSTDYYQFPLTATINAASYQTTEGAFYFRANSGTGSAAVALLLLRPNVNFNITLKSESTTGSYLNKHTVSYVLF